MSTQGVRIMKPLEEELSPSPSEVFLNKETPNRLISVLTILFSSISAAFAVIVFAQAHF